MLVRLRPRALVRVDHEQEEVDPVAPATIVRTKRSCPGRRRPRAACRRAARAARSRGRSRCRARAPAAGGRCSCPSAPRRASSCRGRCGPRCRRSAAWRPQPPGQRDRRDLVDLVVASVRQSSRSFPSRTMPTTGGSPTRSGAASDSSSAHAKLGSSASGSAPPPTRATVSSTVPPTSAASRSARARTASASSRSIRSTGNSLRRVEVEAQRSLERRERQLVGAQRPLQRMAAQPLDEVGAPDDDARPAARRAACRPRSRRGRRRPRATPAPSGSSAAASTSTPEPRSSTSGSPWRCATAASSSSVGSSVKPTTRKFDWCTRRSSAVSGADGALVVGGARAVRRADLDEPRARAREHVGDAEAVADLDQLAARDDHLASLGERGEREQDRGGVVVDDERRLGAGQPAQDRGDVILPRAARAVAQVELEVRVAARRPRSTRASASAASGARPRFVCTITPVAFRTRRRLGARAARELVAQALHEVARDRRPRGSPRARGRARPARRRPRADRRRPRASSSTDGRSRSSTLERLLTLKAGCLVADRRRGGPPLSPLARDRRARDLGDRLCLHLRATGVPRPGLPAHDVKPLSYVCRRATAGRGRSARPGFRIGHDESRWNMSAIHWRDLSALRIAARAPGVDPQSLRVIDAARLLPGPRERPFLLVGGRDARGRTCIGAQPGRRGVRPVLLPGTARATASRSSSSSTSAPSSCGEWSIYVERRRQRGRDPRDDHDGRRDGTRYVRGTKRTVTPEGPYPFYDRTSLRAHVGDDHVVPRAARPVERAHRLLRRDTASSHAARSATRSPAPTSAPAVRPRSS